MSLPYDQELAQQLLQTTEVSGFTGRYDNNLRGKTAACIALMLATDERGANAETRDRLFRSFPVMISILSLKPDIDTEVAVDVVAHVTDDIKNIRSKDNEDRRSRRYQDLAMGWEAIIALRAELAKLLAAINKLGHNLIKDLSGHFFTLMKSAGTTKEVWREARQAQNLTSQLETFSAFIEASEATDTSTGEDDEDDD